MRARIATIAGLVSIAVLVAPAATAEECKLVDQVFERCQGGSEPPPPEPQPQPQPAPAPQPEAEPAPAPQPAAQANPGHRPAAVARILALMNNERRGKGLPQLALRADVSALSAPHSEAMAAKGTIWHNDAYFAPAVKKRLDARLLGENVARNTDIDDAHRRLMNSPGHRANILDGRFTVVGLAVYDDGWGNLYVTQSFVQPNTAAAPKPAADAAEKPRSAPAAPTTVPPSTTTTQAAPEPAPAVLSAGPEVDVAPAQSTEEPAPEGPNRALLAVVALLALGSAAVYTFRAKLHFLVPAADR
jgi:uncharacterized protein YkwD